MKILILGLGKSGTTAMLYKISGGLPNCKAFSGGRPGKYVGDYENAVYKHTYEERKGKSFELYREHLQKEQYDRKIWIARDPRDSAISRMLYRWHKGYLGHRKQYEAHLELVLQKEKDPKSVAFCDICRNTGHNGWPIATQEVIEEERNRYGQMRKFVEGLGEDWLLFKYEDMVEKKFTALNEYLAFDVTGNAEVPKGTGKEKVVRKKAYGDWRQWFTEKDVELFKPAYTPYMELIGYDCDDWTLDPQPVIEPEYSSVYMQSLPAKVTKNVVLRYVDNLLQRWFKKG